MTGRHRIEVELEDRVLAWSGHLSVTSNRESFYYKYTRKLTVDGASVREKTWEETIPRDFQ